MEPAAADTAIRSEREADEVTSVCQMLMGNVCAFKRVEVVFHLNLFPSFFQLKTLKKFSVQIQIA